MKLRSEMLLDSNWNKYALVVDAEESADYVEEQILNLFGFEKGSEEFEEKMEEVLNHDGEGICVWSLNELEGREGGWMYEELIDEYHGPKEIQLMYEFVRMPDDIEFDPHYLVELPENDDEWIVNCGDEYEDVIVQLNDLRVINTL